MKNYWFIILFIPLMLSSCFTTSDLIEATPLGKGNNSIDFRANGQLFLPIVESSGAGGDVSFPGTFNSTLEYSRGITETGDLGASWYTNSLGLGVHWKQNFVNNEKYAFALRPSVGYVGIWGDQFGLDILNTFKISEKMNLLVNGSIYSQSIISARTSGFLSESVTVGMSFGKKHKFKVGLTFANFSPLEKDVWGDDYQNYIIGPNLAYQLSW